MTIRRPNTGLCDDATCAIWTPHIQHLGPKVTVAPVQQFPKITLGYPEPDSISFHAEVESMTSRVVQQIRDAEDSQARSLLLSAYAAGEAGVPFETFLAYLLEQHR